MELDKRELEIILTIAKGIIEENEIRSIQGEP